MELGFDILSKMEEMNDGCLSTDYEWDSKCHRKFANLLVTNNCQMSRTPIGNCESRVLRNPDL